MLLNASAGGGQKGDIKTNEKIRQQQEQIMNNIQSLIEKPIIVQNVGLEASYGQSHISASKGGLQSSQNIASSRAHV